MSFLHLVTMTSFDINLDLGCRCSSRHIPSINLICTLNTQVGGLQSSMSTRTERLSDKRITVYFLALESYLINHVIINHEIYNHNNHNAAFGEHSAGAVISAKER